MVSLGAVLFMYTEATGDDGNDLPRFGSLAKPPLSVTTPTTPPPPPPSVSLDSKFNFRFSTVRRNDEFFTRLVL